MLFEGARLRWLLASPSFTRWCHPRGVRDAEFASDMAESCCSSSPSISLATSSSLSCRPRRACNAARTPFQDICNLYLRTILREIRSAEMISFYRSSFNTFFFVSFPLPSGPCPAHVPGQTALCDGTRNLLLNIVEPSPPESPRIFLTHRK